MTHDITDLKAYAIASHWSSQLEAMGFFPGNNYCFDVKKGFLVSTENRRAFFYFGGNNLVIRVAEPCEISTQYNDYVTVAIIARHPGKNYTHQELCAEISCPITALIKLMKLIKPELKYVKLRDGIHACKKESLDAMLQKYLWIAALAG